MYMPTRVYKTSEIPKKCSPFLINTPPQKKNNFFPQFIEVDNFKQKKY